MLTVHTCCDRDHMTRNGIVHLDCWRTKILPLLGVLSALIYTLWSFCPMVLLSIGAFLCAPTWWWFSTPVSHDHMTRNEIVHLDCWRTKILPLLGVLSAFLFILWGFCPMVIFSIVAFLCVPTWCWLSTRVSLDHMTRNGIVHLDFWGTKILNLLVVLSALIFILWFFCPMVLLSILAFLCALTWCWLSTPAVIVITWPEMGLYTLIVGVLKDCLFWMFCPLWLLSFDAFVLWCFCPLGLFSVRPRDVDCPHLLWSWSHDQKWDCTLWLLAY